MPGEDSEGRPDWAGKRWSCLASKAVGGRPVKLLLSRMENFASAASRDGMVANVKAGFKKDGKCTAYEVRFVARRRCIR